MNSEAEADENCEDVASEVSYLSGKQGIFSILLLFASNTISLDYNVRPCNLQRGSTQNNG